MDGRNRQRFAQDGQLLGSWLSASTVMGTPSRPDAESEGGHAGRRGGEARSVRRALSGRFEEL